MTPDINHHVGRVLRKRRRMLDLTQAELAARVGLKAQQIHKYETGINRITVGRLWRLSRALDLPVSSFFAGLEGA